MDEFEDEIKEAREELLFTMSGISEDQYCAGWMSGLEFYLWRMVTEGKPYGRMSEIKAKHIGGMLLELSEKAGGWWMWSKEENDKVFVSMWHWKKVFKERKA